MAETGRRHDLDWLRVIVFGFLIFYHVGMFFVPWGFHVKNNVIYPWLQWPMLFLNQWRLPILFVISGMGTYYALGRRSGGAFIGEQLSRLALPLAFGMLVIVPPQVFFERLAQGEFSGHYFQFWPLQALTGIYPEGNLSWHHLWFLPYLFLYSVMLLPLFLYLRKRPDAGFTRWIKRIVVLPLGLYIFIIPLYFIEAFIEPFFPVTHALIDDWFTFVNFLVLFFFGYVLIAVKDAFWHAVQHRRRFYLASGLVLFTAMTMLRYFYEDSIAIHFIEAFLKVANLWSWILALFGYAATYLNQDSRVLRYCNRAVYPFYILHQTVTIAIGYYLMDLNWGFVSKAGLMVTGTFGISFILYELLIRRITWLGPLFGLKKPNKS